MNVFFNDVFVTEEKNVNDSNCNEYRVRGAAISNTEAKCKATATHGNPHRCILLKPKSGHLMSNITLKLTKLQCHNEILHNHGYQFDFGLIGLNKNLENRDSKWQALAGMIEGFDRSFSIHSICKFSVARDYIKRLCGIDFKKNDIQLIYLRCLYACSSFANNNNNNSNNEYRSLNTVNTGVDSKNDNKDNNENNNGCSKGDHKWLVEIRQSRADRIDNKQCLVTKQYQDRKFVYTDKHDENKCFEWSQLTENECLFKENDMITIDIKRNVFIKNSYYIRFIKNNDIIIGSRAKGYVM